MATYLITFEFTQKGVEQIKDSPARVEAAKQVVKSQGGEMKAFYGVLGARFDTLFIVEAPDDEAMGRMVAGIAKEGCVRTQTHRLFNEEEYRRVLAAVP